MRFKRTVSAYVKKLPITGREDPYNPDVIRFWVEVPRAALIEHQQPRLLLGWQLLRLFWRAWRSA